jgi:hypothetical protein
MRRTSSRVGWRAAWRARAIRPPFGKVDIEGSEYDLVDAYPTLLERTRLLAMEIHQTARPASVLLEAIAAAGLRHSLPHIQKGLNLLVVFKRETRG